MYARQLSNSSFKFTFHTKQRDGGRESADFKFREHWRKNMHWKISLQFISCLAQKM